MKKHAKTHKSNSVVTSKQLTKAACAAVATQFAMLKEGDKDDDSIGVLIAGLSVKLASKSSKSISFELDKDA